MHNSTSIPSTQEIKIQQAIQHNSGRKVIVRLTLLKQGLSKI